MKRRNTAFLQFIVITVICLFSVKMNADADGSFKKVKLKYDEVQTIQNITFGYGDDTFYYLYNGHQYNLPYESDYGEVDDTIITDGNTIFYIVKYSDDTDVLYKTVVGKSSEKLHTANQYDYMRLECCTNNKLYFISGIDPGYFYSYDLISKKKKIIDKNTTTVEWYKNYAYLHPYEGMPGPGKKIKVYNIKTNKKKTICDSTGYFCIYKGKLYYSYNYKENYEAYAHDVMIMRCNPDGSHKKKMTKKFRVNFILKLTDKSVEYRKADGSSLGKKVKKKYSKLK